MVQIYKYPKIDEAGADEGGGTQPDRMSCCETVRICLNPEFFKALCDPTRLCVLLSLARCSEAGTVSEVAECCEVDLSVVSRHLKILRDAGIADAEKQGKEVRYTIRYDDVVRTLRDLADAIERCCPEAKNACNPCCGQSDDNPTDARADTTNPGSPSGKE